MLWRLVKKRKILLQNTIYFVGIVDYTYFFLVFGDFLAVLGLLLPFLPFDGEGDLAGATTSSGSSLGGSCTMNVCLYASRAVLISSRILSNEA